MGYVRDLRKSEGDICCEPLDYFEDLHSRMAAYVYERPEIFHEGDGEGECDSRLVFELGSKTYWIAGTYEKPVEGAPEVFQVNGGDATIAVASAIAALRRAFEADERGDYSEFVFCAMEAAVQHEKAALGSIAPSVRESYFAKLQRSAANKRAAKTPRKVTDEMLSAVVDQLGGSFNRENKKHGTSVRMMVTGANGISLNAACERIAKRPDTGATARAIRDAFLKKHSAN